MTDTKMAQDRTTNPNPKGKQITTEELARRAAPFDEVTPADYKNLDDFQKDRTTPPKKMMGGGHVKKYRCGGEVKKYSHGGMNCPHRQDGVRGGGIAQGGMKFTGTR
jgi:hypothetical protein